MFPGHNKVKAAIERHLAMVQDNQMDGGLHCQIGTAKNPQTHWTSKSTGAPPSQPAPPRPRTPPAPPHDSETTPRSKTAGVQPGYVYVHTPPSSVRCFNCESYAMDLMHYDDCIPDSRTDEGPSTG